jgi:Family of unknown function (DUF6527)
MNPDHGNMTRDDRDEWPADVVIGTFDISGGEPGHTVGGYPGATGHLLFVCPSGKRCGVLVGPSPVDRPNPDACCVWGWNGDRDRPTLTPSINCIAEKDGKPTGGCGWHGHITAGVIR